jgi:NAD-dependent dihydropyrimidine dehydrogenase PreA subunit
MSMKYLKNVASIRIDPQLCRGCGQCLTVCPHRVIELRDKKAVVADRDACMECGACRRNCPFAAVTVTAGVGCAYAILNGMWRGTAPSCGCGGNAE